MDEEALWPAAKAGDGDAFGAIFDLHGDRVYRHARRLTATVVDAEDVTASAFFELWRRRRSVRVVEGSVLPWLLVTTTNLSRNLARGLRRYRAMLAQLPRSSVEPNAEELVLTGVGDERLRHDIRQAFAQLKPTDAALVALTSFEDYTPAQAAAALGISAGTARTRLHRARSRLADALGEWEHLAAPELPEEGCP